MFQDRFKDQGIELIEVINDRIKEMVKMGVGKKHNEIHKQLACKILREHHDMPAYPEQPALLLGAKALLQDGKTGFQQL